MRVLRVRVRHCTRYHPSGSTILPYSSCHLQLTTKVPVYCRYCPQITNIDKRLRTYRRIASIASMTGKLKSHKIPIASVCVCARARKFCIFVGLCARVYVSFDCFLMFARKRANAKYHSILFARASVHVFLIVCMYVSVYVRTCVCLCVCICPIACHHCGAHALHLTWHRQTYKSTRTYSLSRHTHRYTHTHLHRFACTYLIAQAQTDVFIASPPNLRPVKVQYTPERKTYMHHAHTS